MKWSIESKDVDKQREFKNQILHFIDAVRFFNENLAKEFLIDLPSAS